MDSTSEGRLKEICPVFANRVRQAAQALLERHDVTVRVIQALRSWSMQQELWQQGRDTEGCVIDPKKVITDAPPGHSFHEFGLAVDVAPFDIQGQPIWETKVSPGKEIWGSIVAIAQESGLLDGVCFGNLGDLGHWQPLECPHEPTDEIRIWFREGGMSSVWTELGLTGREI